MIINPNIELAIQKYIQNHLNECETCKIIDLLQNYSGFVQVTKAELINTINNSLRAGNIKIIEEKTPWENSTIILVSPFTIINTSENISIVVSKPRLRELSVGSIEERNKQVDSIDCFREIIVSAKNVLRICSPFIQKNVLSEDSFPELRKLLINALKRNVEIRLLSRELYQGRDKEIQWIIDIADNLGKMDNLIIVDYHLSMEDGTILSSTHAKIIIADYDMAYIGSAELRRNSLVTNFEIGCLIRGSQVFGICEVFDFIFSRGRIWK